MISIYFLAYADIGAAVLAIAFGTFLFIKAKRLSSFYLFLLCTIFAIYSFGDFATWILSEDLGMSVWSVLDVLSVSFFILSFWFLYTFVKERDLPMWLKVLTASALIPTLVVTALSINLNTWVVPSGMAIDNAVVANYHSCLYGFFILLTIIFTIIEYRKALDTVNKKKIALAGIGVATFLFAYFFVYAIVNFVIAINLWNLALTGYAYIISPYALFGMPILLAFLGYLIAKYQAFDVRLIKSIAYMIVLMVLLFIGLFFA